MATTDYYTQEENSTWDRIKKAFANDWEQTKADFGVDGNRDMDQDVDDTVKQMAGSDNSFENREQALRFGYTAKQRYGREHPEWDDVLDDHLRKEYPGKYDQDRDYIKHGYGYEG